MRYFEIGFDNEPTETDYDEDYSGNYSICILAEKEPSIEEATEFCKSDMKNLGYKYVVSITEISKEEATNFFDMEDAENRYPIFK